MKHKIPNFDNRSWTYWSEPTIVDVDGLPTAYRRAGEGETLVYLHGGGGTRGWYPWHDKFASRFDLVAPEHPGFGDTPRPDHFSGWEDWILHYDAFFRKLGLRDFHLAGTSVGAWLAANLAIYYPERYRSLTLITPLGARIVDEPFIDIFRKRPAEGLSDLFNGREVDYLEMLDQEGPFEDGIHMYEENSTAALLMFNPRYDIKFDNRLSRITIPTTVVGVDEDRVVGDQQARRFAELIPNSEFRQIAGKEGAPSGHAVIIEQSDDVLDTLVQNAGFELVGQES